MKIKGVLLLLFAFSLYGCKEETVRSDQPIHKETAEKITAAEVTEYEGRFLEEKLEEDLTGDGINEIIELYISPPPVIDENGEYGWDDSHYWQLIVNVGDQTYPLFNDHIQFGAIRFWIIEDNKGKEVVLLSEGSQLFMNSYRFDGEAFIKTEHYSNDGGIINQRSTPEW